MRDLFLTMTSLMPGSLPTGVDEHGMLLMHCLDTEQPLADADSGWHRRGLLPLLGGCRCSGRRLRRWRDPSRHGDSRLYLRLERGSRRECFLLRFLLVAGVIIFVVAGLAGFLAYPVGFAKPIIILIEVAMIFSIAATLGLLVAGAPGRSANR
ncbi:MAG TPA: hypothetical protein VIS96_17190 [Terrimicrobiaceae bacterium]